MPIETIIFDMDGVLVDSEVYWAQARYEFAEERGLQWNDTFQREAMGQSTIGWARVMQSRLNLDEHTDDIIVEMKSRVLAKYEVKTPLRPGAYEAVEFATANYRCGLASGSPTNIIETVIRTTGMDKLFETVVFGDTVPNGKPAPDIYLEALNRLDAAPATSIGIEDSAHGIHALKAAGMIAIAAPSPDFPLPQAVLILADAHITSMENFTPDLLKQLEAMQ
ncbi:MAG: HAD family phosphatase [Chloroflexota bacterium]